MIEFPQVPHLKEAQQAEDILSSHSYDQTVIIYSLSEIPLLRFLRRVRDGKLAPGEFEIEMMFKGGSQRIKVDETGELLDRCKEGFFEGRSEELF